MSEKNVKARLRFGLRKKGSHIGTNIFKIVKRHSEGIYLVLQDGLTAEMIAPDEIMIKGSKIQVTFEDADGPARQRTYVPADIEKIHAGETALQHLAYEKGYTSEDVTVSNCRVSQSTPPMEEKTL